MTRVRAKSRPLAYLGFLTVFLLCSAFVLRAQDGPSGDAAMAERYAQWAQDAIDRGLWSEALAGLERASDFADVSSDVSYLLALALSHENKPRGAVLEALNRALVADRWNANNPEAARLLRAETLIAVKAYPEALNELSGVEKSPRGAALVLKALAASRPWEFLPYMSDTLDRFPRESGPVRIFFAFLRKEDAAGRNPGKEGLEILELILRRLPALLLNDKELAWMAAPFIRDAAEAKRLVEAYRAANRPEAASLPVALRLGAIAEETALEELFAPAEGAASAFGLAPHGGWKESPEKTLDMALLGEVWELLRHEEAKTLFTRNLSAYTGVIVEDENRDGIPESAAKYSGGTLQLYTHDANQGGDPEMTVFFEAGDPRRALALLPPESSRGLQTANVEWERYPAVRETELGGVRYIPRPFDFHYSPLAFAELWGSGLLFPQWDSLNPPLTRRVLVSRALRAERPSLEFEGALERVELAAGLPVAGREYIGERAVSETEFLRGRPQLQRVDLDLDGRMETVRFFRRGYRPAELEELWDYDRNIEYSVSDFDGDGIFENRDSYDEP